MKLELIGPWNLDKVKHALFTQGNMSPLCGWGYAYQSRNFQPECRVELIGPGYKSTMTIKSPSIFKDVLRVYRNPYIKINLTAKHPGLGD